jgi:hypothetical protein
MNHFLKPEHRQTIMSMPPPLRKIAWDCLVKRDPTFPHPDPERDDPPSGPDFLQALDNHPIDHLALVFPMCRESTAGVIQALELLVGKPITRHVPRAPRVVRSPSNPSPARVVDTRRVAAVAPNPKRPSSESFTRYSHWTVGATVAECIARGLTKGDVNWDTSHGFVTLETE